MFSAVQWSRLHVMALVNICYPLVINALSPSRVDAWETVVNLT